MTAYKSRIVSGGRLQIPADVRKALGLADGDDVRLEVVDGELRVRSFKAALARVRAMVREHVPDGVSLTEELMADRRAAAASE
ncbi:AbrB/MazE/SpoVT family DNA-binding domain-containing protein [Sphingobium sp. D43FB]|uniref:AbrB/MazE/SpoVT family DNA-binding domain-containing protein n=1 Tax=Sphingobium sp. D43FB TaxID=2017595 RepID=UPI000BB575BF|nr:AbrB/MazE/SpoVT family DNA-binding domain-containing protein [Sphingobium sp. D43FB]PBN42894.1 AbrB family transcriptional regulator [Sphingobium sp. D43FB]